MSDLSQLVRTEADALTALATSLESTLAAPAEQALDLLAAARLVAVTGVGKSGIIARKIAATLTSTGTPALFLHPTEALHGDLGLITPQDAVLALSYSGETDELLRLLPALTRIGAPLVALTGCATSTLARAAQVTLTTTVSAEACHNNLAPTASTTVMLALGDALALELSRRSRFHPTDFAALHPGGRLGRLLTPVHALMHTGDRLPRVTPATPMSVVIHEMSDKKLGMTTVLNPDETLAGILSDGDLRRLLEQHGAAILDRTAGTIMNPNPQTISPQALASEALTRMEAGKITSLVVVGDTKVLGVIHLHDILR